MGLLSPVHLMLVFAIALLVFGPKKLPEIGRSIGSALREFKKASSEFMDAINNPEPEDHTPPPVKSIEYPAMPALAEAQHPETLPYGAEFHPAEHEPTAELAPHPWVERTEPALAGAATESHPVDHAVPHPAEPLSGAAAEAAPERKA